MNSGAYVFIGLMIFVIVMVVVYLLNKIIFKKESNTEDNESVSSKDSESVSSEDNESVSSEDNESVSSKDNESVSNEDNESVSSEDNEESKERYPEEEHDMSIMPVYEEPAQETREPENIVPVIEDTSMSNKRTARMCVYTNQYERCDVKCGRGKRFRVQLPYNHNQHYDQEPHECVPDEDREFRQCTGIVCDETYTYPTFIKNNPGKGFTEYCEFIVENDACDDNYVRQNNLCSAQCS